MKAIAEALLLAHAAVVIWTLRRKTIAPVIALNIIVSGGVVAYWVGRLPELFGYIDLVQAFVGIEVAVLAISLLALRFRVPRALLWSAFIVHAFLVAAALAFMFTFKLPRMM